MNERPQHILGIEPTNALPIPLILDKARDYRAFFSRHSHCHDLEGVLVVNAFFENSTRTKSSFDIAAKRLGADVVSFGSSGSSISKGESLYDTLQTLDAMAPDCLVMRHRCSGAAEYASRHVRAHVLNAGDGTHEHPTQALLDAMTLIDEFGSLEGKTIGIVGDIAHSRVARSNMHLLPLLGAKVLVCSPPTLMPREWDISGVERVSSLTELLERCDAVMTLRLQLERMQSGLVPSFNEYHRHYALRQPVVSRFPQLKVLHPGPVNYGVEIDYELANGPQSLIRKQVANGVFIRMACLWLLCTSANV